MESGATTNNYAYGYDLAGNRTSATVNGVTTTRSYDAANQVVGWSYEAAGNLLNDGSSAYTYDALGRTTGQGGTALAYNGDGVLVAQTSAGVTTRYTQDLAAPLSQILHDGTANYLYGHERLRAANGPWYLADALGSLRLTLDGAGAPLATASYDPWGTPASGMIAPFGFTGELQDAAGLTYLRARWYTPGAGTFTSRDSFPGFPEQPYSQHPYNYALSDPVNFTDPTGRCAWWALLWFNPDPTCQYIGNERVLRGDLNWEAGLPWGGAAVDFTPVVGDIKGLAEVITGCDIVTGEELGNWRWLGLLGVSELRQLRQLKALPPPRTATELRALVGTAAGGYRLPIVTGTWLRGSQGNVGRIPGQIAAKLRGRQFRDFEHFRQEFWKEVAADPALARQFTPQNRANMANGKAPYAKPEQHSDFFPGDSGVRYNLHHVTPINQGGGVYDLDNIIIVSPRYHEELLDPIYHGLPYDPATQRDQEFRP